MILLYQDPKGELVGTTLRMTTNANVAQTGSGPTVRSKVNPSELESKVASLEKLVTELRNENEALKVSTCMTPIAVYMHMLHYSIACHHIIIIIIILGQQDQE